MAEVSSVALFTGHIEHALAFYRAVGLQLHRDWPGGCRKLTGGPPSACWPARCPVGLIEDPQESYRQGTTVMAADLLRYSRPSGFGLEGVTTTVHLWHGAQDPKVAITPPASWRPASLTAGSTQAPAAT